MAGVGNLKTIGNRRGTIVGAQTTVLEVVTIDMDGSSTLLTVNVIEGTLPEGDFGPASVFFDPLRGDCGGVGADG